MSNSDDPRPWAWSTPVTSRHPAPYHLNTEVADASDPLFSDPAGCALYKQASFAESWFPEDTEVGPDSDVDYFILPAIDPGQDDPLVTGGDGAVQFDDREEVNKLMTYLATPDGAASRAKRGGFVSARTSVDNDTYYHGASRRFSELLVDAPVSRFEASDVMPAIVGSGLLWSAITEWISGTITLDELVTSVDDALELEGQP